MKKLRKRKFPMRELRQNWNNLNERERMLMLLLSAFPIYADNTNVDTWIYYWTHFLNMGRKPEQYINFSDLKLSPEHYEVFNGIDYSNS